MILVHLLALALGAVGIAFMAGRALTATGRNRIFAGGAAIGIAAVSQQFLVVVLGGVLQILVGLVKRRSKDPQVRASAKINFAVGVVIIGVAIYFFYIR